MLPPTAETGIGSEDMEVKRQKHEKHRATEHEILEKLHQESTGSKVYQPYFPTQQKAIRKHQYGEKKSEIFESSTDNDYLSVIEAKRHRYIKDKLLVKDLATRVREVLLDPTIDPDFEIS